MCRFPHLKLAAAAAVLLASAAQGQAGSANEIHILQDSRESSGPGNTLTVDQSGANSSLVIGPSDELVDNILALPPAASPGVFSGEGQNLVEFSPLGPSGGPFPLARQLGTNNEARLVITGTGGELQLLQDNTSVQDATGNFATVTAQGSNVLGGVIQIGDDNTAALTLTGTGATGLISQFGTSLQADLTVGAGGSGQIVQIGNNNNTGPVEVLSSGTVTYTQIGDNLQPVGATGVNVISTTNVGNISITQTGF